MFHSKTEAYLYAIHFLSRLKTKPEDEIQTLRVWVENHEQAPTKAVNLLQQLAVRHSYPESIRQDLKKIAKAINESTYEQTEDKQFENPIGRRFESDMQVTLLQNPTSAMMTAVGCVSDALADILNQLNSGDSTRRVIQTFLNKLTSTAPESNPEQFGAPPTALSFSELMALLKDNKAEQLTNILYTHYLFAKTCMRDIMDLVSPPNQSGCCGEFGAVAKDFFQQHQQTESSIRLYKFAGIVCDWLFNTHRPALFHDRGRGHFIKKASNRMGIMLNEQEQNDLPTQEPAWMPDAKCQEPDFCSPCVLDLINNDVVYVAGPSGMTTLFLNIMEVYGNLETETLKKNYLAAVSAYMVSGGFHSLHEVLAPAQFGLKLIPDYIVSIPRRGQQSRPPNYHQFYAQQMAIDAEFQGVYEAGWKRVMQSFQQHVIRRGLEKPYNNQFFKEKGESPLSQKDSSSPSPAR